MSAREYRDRSREGTPSKFPETNPPTPQSDYGVHIMQSILEMQRTLGGIENAMKNLEATTRAHGDKLGEIGQDVYAAKVVMGVVGTLIVIAGGVIAWVINTYLSTK